VNQIAADRVGETEAPAVSAVSRTTVREQPLQMPVRVFEERVVRIIPVEIQQAKRGHGPDDRVFARRIEQAEFLVHQVVKKRESSRWSQGETRPAVIQLFHAEAQ